jgi:hypothetical protein
MLTSIAILVKELIFSLHNYLGRRYLLSGRALEGVNSVLPTIILSCIRLHAYALHSLGISSKKFSRRFYFLKIVRITYGFRYKFVFKSRLSFFQLLLRIYGFLNQKFLLFMNTPVPHAIINLRKIFQTKKNFSIAIITRTGILL